MPETIFLFIVNQSWKAAILILAILFVRKRLGPRLSPWMRHFLWCFLILVLFVPNSILPRPEIPVTVEKTNEKPMPYRPLDFSHPRKMPQPQEIPIFHDTNQTAINSVALIQANAETTLDVKFTDERIDTGKNFLSVEILAVMWFCGVILLFVHSLVSMLRYYRRIANSEKIHAEMTISLLRSCEKRMKIRRETELYECSRLATPLLAGMGRPRILLPYKFLDNLTQEEATHLFLHELAHRKRRDIVTAWLMSLFCMLHWFNPLVWLALRKMSDDAEEAADRLALDHLPQTQRTDYGMTLLTLAERFCTENITERVPGFVGILENSSQLSRRIEMIKETRKGKRLCLLLAVTLCLGVSYITYAKVRYIEAETPPKETVPKNEIETEEEAFDRWSKTKLDWEFSPEVTELFSPPMNATIKEMNKWADRLTQPFPENMDKWGGYDKYQQRVAYLRMDIADQIVAANPDDITASLAIGDKWYPYFILCQQDKANMPKMAAYYEELKKHNDNHGRNFDRFTENVIGTREAIVRDLMELDEGGKKYVPLAESLLAEFDEMLKETPLGRGAEEIYGRKLQLLRNLAKHEKKYEAVLSEYKKENRNIIRTRENELETSIFYFYFGPDAPYGTPEGIKIHREWLDRISNKAANATDTEFRYDFYRIKGSILDKLLHNKAATEEEFQNHLRKLESLARENDRYVSSYKNDLYNGYFTLFVRKFDQLLENVTISEADLEHIFQSAEHILHAESAYGPGTRAWCIMSNRDRLDKLMNKMTPKQQEYSIKRLEELLVKGEKVEDDWFAAGKRMDSRTELTWLRNFLGLRKLAGQTLDLQGTTVAGESFDLKKLRGKVVLVDFWATWCGPCLREMPELKNLYEKYNARGFEILGISVDTTEDKPKLLEYIEKEKLPWTMLHDPKSILHKECYGPGVPHCILLDRNGKVVLVEARGEALTKKLDEIFH